jgi:glutamate carboxypeptidase
MTTWLDFFKARTESFIETLSLLVHYESPTQRKAHVDALGAFLAAQTAALGAEVQTFPRKAVGDIRLARWGAEQAGPPILILTHLDTVWEVGTLAESIPWRRDESCLYGAGVLDMKAGIAITLEALRGLQERAELPPRPILWLMTTDEETGSEHSRDLILELARGAGVCFVMEPAAENEGLKTSRKGIATYTLTAQGRAAHAGNAPEEGINAIVELAHQTLALNALNNLRKGTSVSVTLVKGGTAGNVIPSKAVCEVDVRFFYQEEMQRVDAAIRALQPVLLGAGLALRGGVNRPPMERTPQIVAAYEQAKGIAQGLGLPLGEAAVGGVSDANLTAGAGVPTLDGLGGQGDGMHALHEHVLIRSLPRRAALLSALLQQWRF